MKQKQWIKIICFLLLFRLLPVWNAQPGLASAETAENTELLWEKKEDGTIIINGVVSPDSVTEIVIPEKIKGREVTEIAYQAFSGLTSLERVSIPKTVRHVVGSAFSGCSSLKEITVDQDNLWLSSEDGVLYDKDKRLLEWVPDTWEGEFIIPESVVDIFPTAFSGCGKITVIEIPESVRLFTAGGMADTLYENAFYGMFSAEGCVSLAAVNVAENHPECVSVDGIVFTKDGKTIVKVPPDYGALVYEVPDGVEQIAWACFDTCSNLQKVIFPASVKRIGSHGFRDCQNLTELVVQEGIEEIWNFAFYFCMNLKEIQMPSTLKEIQKDAFSLSGLNGINIDDIPLVKEEEQLPAAPDGRWSVPERVVLGKELQETEYYEGIYKYRFTTDGEVVLTGLTEEGIAATENQRLVIPKTLGGNTVLAIADGAFAGQQITSVQLSEGLKEIGTGAFYGCNLKNVEIPASVTYIGNRAFGANYRLEMIFVVQENATYCSEEGVLYNKEKTMLLQVPAKYPQTSFTVPEGVFVIGDYAFGNNRNINHITFPVSMVQIMGKAFWNVRCLKEIAVWSDMEYIAPDAYAGNGLLSVVRPIREP